MRTTERMIAFVGEQPAPIALVSLHCGAEETLLIGSQRTIEVAERLKGFFKYENKSANIVKVDDPNDIDAIESVLEKQFAPEKPAPETVFNLTGGTKPMMIAGYRFCERLEIPFVYLESESGNPVLRRYSWEQRSLATSKETVSTPFEILQHLKLCGVRELRQGSPSDFEQKIADKVEGHVDQILLNVWLSANVEVDFIVRCGHTLAVVEVFEPTGKNARFKPKIDQLVHATEPTRLGTYTRRILISSKDLDENNEALAALARVEVMVVNYSLTDDGNEECCIGSRVAEYLGASPRLAGED